MNLLSDFLSDEDRKRLNVTSEGVRPGQGHRPQRPASTNVSHFARFHNPYHFIPIPDSPPRQSHTVRIDEFFADTGPKLEGAERRGHAYSHATYHGLSGRIICSLMTESPVFVGAGRTAGTSGQAAVVESASCPSPHHRVPMIPGSSLRGMISSLAEAVTNSAMRVVEDRSLSYRKDIRAALNCMGMVLREGDRWFLRPLTRPPKSSDQSLTHEFQRIFDDDYETGVRIYIGHYKSSDWLAELKSYRHDDPEFYYLPQSMIRYNAFQGGDAGKTRPISQSEYEQLDNKDDYIRGILYVLGRSAVRDLPDNKMRELFIPYPQHVESRPVFHLPKETLDTFHSIADERHDDTETDCEKMLPYTPRGTRRNDNPEQYGARVRLKHGDIVYFSVAKGSNGWFVDEVSFSAIWRGQKRHNGRLVTTHSFLEEANPDLVPLGSPSRRRLTPAELLFGVVEEKSKGIGSTSSKARAYASRVRITEARVQPRSNHDYFEDETTLKILDGPKPPSPALYFKPKVGSGYISKDDLNPELHTIQGRKMYLHQYPEPRGNPPRAPWESRLTRPGDPNSRLEQKAKIRPWKAGLRFYFHVDFDNLSEWELSLLLYVLRPTDTFRHKIGLGKPIGLGTVSIRPEGVFLVNRSQRYLRDNLTDPRYAAVHLTSDARVAEWPSRYDTERRAADGVAPRAWRPDDEKNVFSPEPSVARAIALLGDPQCLRAPVHYPQLGSISLDEEKFEMEHFKWFVENTRNRYEALEAISESTKQIPVLPRFTAQQGSAQRTGRQRGGGVRRNRQRQDRSGTKSGPRHRRGQRPNRGEQPRF